MKKPYRAGTVPGFLFSRNFCIGEPFGNPLSSNDDERTESRKPVDLSGMWLASRQRRTSENTVGWLSDIKRWVTIPCSMFRNHVHGER